MNRFIHAVVLAAAIASATTAHAQSDYPNRPVRLIMPNAPGSSIDTLGRILATRLPEALGQSIVIENRAGAAGIVGMEGGKTAPPDGYTLVVASASNLTVAPLVQKKVPYDPLTDFTFLSTFAVMPNVLVVYPGLPVKNVRELIEHAQANPGKLHMASAGPGAASHLAGVLLMTLGKFDALHVPYKGGGPSVGSVVAGESHWTLAPAPAAMAAVRGGRLRAIAHSLGSRSALLPDLPTIAETVPGYDYSGWAGLLAPRGTPQIVLDRVHAALAKTVAIPQVKEQMAAQGADAVLHAGEAFKKFVEADLANNARIIKIANIKLD